jgi:hypothetical protein
VHHRLVHDGLGGPERSPTDSGSPIPAAVFAQVERANSLVELGGQGQDRTVDLPLFSPAVVAVTATRAAGKCSNYIDLDRPAWTRIRILTCANDLQ